MNAESEFADLRVPHEANRRDEQVAKGTMITKKLGNKSSRKFASSQSRKSVTCFGVIRIWWWSLRCTLYVLSARTSTLREESAAGIEPSNLFPTPPENYPVWPEHGSTRVILRALTTGPICRVHYTSSVPVANTCFKIPLLFGHREDFYRLPSLFL